MVLPEELVWREDGEEGVFRHRSGRNAAQHKAYNSWASCDDLWVNSTVLVVPEVRLNFLEGVEGSSSEGNELLAISGAALRENNERVLRLACSQLSLVLSDLLDGLPS
uniref:Uncharacterized protein n=1 Tax=Strombidium inclinatum TaxID=197538 RepID=A0A7S3ILW9_9SPIT